MEQPNSELEYICNSIKQLTQRIYKQREKIEKIRKEFDDEPLYEIQLLKRLYAKRYSLNYKKKRILNNK